jgi:hypothetical protein
MTGASMPAIEFADGDIQIDAAIVAAGLGILPARFMEQLQEGKITNLCEKGVDQDNGRYRLTFYAGNRRFRLVIDESGAILQRSTINYGERSTSAAGRRQVRI